MKPKSTGRGSLHALMRRKSTLAFLMTLPLIVLLVVLVAYPTGFAVHLSMLNKSATRFIGLDNFVRLAGSDRFWMLVAQTCLYALIAVGVSAITGFVVAHLVNNVPSRRQRIWRGLLLLPWVIPLAMSVPAWRLLFDPSFSAFNWVLQSIGIAKVDWFVEAGWARFAVVLVTVWATAPFFLVMYLASLKSVPEELYEAASIDGATWWQRLRFITLPMMRNVIAVTALYALIVTFSGFTIVNVLTGGGPQGATRVLGTSAFGIGILGGNLPMGAAVALSMVPILGTAAIFLLRGVTRRGS